MTYKSKNEEDTNNCEEWPTIDDFLLDEDKENCIFKVKSVNFKSLLQIVAIAIVLCLCILHIILNSHEDDMINREITHESSEAYNYSTEIADLTLKITELSHKLDQFLTKKNRISYFEEQFNDKIEHKIYRAIAIYDADKLAKIDYALESSGASISALLPPTRPYSTGGWVSNIPGLGWTSSPRHLINPNVLPGHCFAFIGREARVRIALSSWRVHIDAVSLEQTNIALVDDTRSFPRIFKVYGIDSNKNVKDLGTFEYLLDELRPLQTFLIQSSNLNENFDMIDLHVIDNYGHPEFTCVYRFRVHGTTKP